MNSAGLALHSSRVALKAKRLSLAVMHMLAAARAYDLAGENRLWPSGQLWRAGIGNRRVENPDSMRGDCIDGPFAGS